MEKEVNSNIIKRKIDSQEGKTTKKRESRKKIEMPKNCPLKYKVSLGGGK
jgi:hypothetical protein